MCSFCNNQVVRGDNNNRYERNRVRGTIIIISKTLNPKSYRVMNRKHKNRTPGDICPVLPSVSLKFGDKICRYKRHKRHLFYTRDTCYKRHLFYFYSSTSLFQYMVLLSGQRFITVRLLKQSDGRQIVSRSES